MNMHEIPPVSPETIKNKPETIDNREVSKAELEKRFAENRKEMRQFRLGSNSYYFNQGELVVDEDFVKNFSQEEHLKRVTEKFKERTKNYKSILGEGGKILGQLSDVMGKESYKFVLGEIYKNSSTFSDYHNECMEILRNSDTSDVLKSISEHIASTKIRKSRYYLYSYILAELIPEMKSSSDEDNLEELLDKSEVRDSDIFMLFMAMKAAKAAGEKIDFETMKKLKIEKRLIGEKDEDSQEMELSEEEKEDMMKMVEKNYREVVFPKNPEAAEGVIKEFREELYGPDNFHGQIVYTLKFQDRIAGMVRFDPNKEGLKEGEIYAASFNIHQEVNNTCLGKYLTNAALPEILKKYKRIKAITRADNPMAMHQDPNRPSPYENQGFVIDWEHPFEKNGETYYDMVMEKKI